MNDLESPQANAEAKGPTLYYIVPMAPTVKQPVSFRYFDKSGKPVTSSPPVLNCDRGANAVLIQSTLYVPNQEQPYPGALVDAHLMAAVAKTFADTPPLQKLIAAVDNAVTVQVTENTRRGVILVFQLVGADGITYDLVATHDPEIKNSTAITQS